MAIKSPLPSETVILIADDDLPTRQLLTKLLQHEGYVVQVATDGPDALERFVQWHPDLLLIDALMPGLNGFEVCRQLRQMPMADSMPIIMITALDDQASIISAFEAGATDFITK